MAEWEDFCGCCGNPCGRGLMFCARCSKPKHIAPADGRPPWGRTYFSLYGTDCPFQVVPTEPEEAGDVNISWPRRGAS